LSLFQILSAEASSTIRKIEAPIAPQSLHVGPVFARSRLLEETAGIYSTPLVRAIRGKTEKRPEGRKVSVESLVNSGAKLLQAVNDSICIALVPKPGTHLFHVGSVMEEVLYEVIITRRDSSCTQADPSVRLITSLQTE